MNVPTEKVPLKEEAISELCKCSGTQFDGGIVKVLVEILEENGDGEVIKMKEIEIGKISHYFNHISVAAIKIEKDELKKGDRVRIKGHSEDFIQEITSMQYEHSSIDLARVGDDIAFKVDRKVRKGDTVYKIVEE